MQKQKPVKNNLIEIMTTTLFALCLFFAGLQVSHAQAKLPNAAMSRKHRKFFIALWLIAAILISSASAHHLRRVRWRCVGAYTFDLTVEALAKAPFPLL
jgi:hypothetical protein